MRRGRPPRKSLCAKLKRAWRMLKKERAAFIEKRLQELYPEQLIPLDHKDPYTLLVAVLLSAQCTDARVNQITPALFELADNPFDMASQNVEVIRQIIRPCGLSPQKSSAIKRLSEILVEKFNGVVPQDMAALETLPGVGHNRQRSDVPSLWRARLRRRHSYSPLGPALGPDKRQKRGANGERPQIPLPQGKVELATPANYFLWPRILQRQRLRRHGVRDMHHFVPQAQKAANSVQTLVDDMAP